MKIELHGTIHLNSERTHRSLIIEEYKYDHLIRGNTYRFHYRIFEPGEKGYDTFNGNGKIFSLSVAIKEASRLIRNWDLEDLESKSK